MMLYEIQGRVWDLGVDAEKEPERYAEAVREAGLPEGNFKVEIDYGFMGEYPSYDEILKADGLIAEKVKREYKAGLLEMSYVRLK